MILQSKNIESAVAEITCGNKTGSAFCVHSTEDTQLLLTAYHNVSDSGASEILLTTIGTETISIPLELLDHDPEMDVAILVMPGSRLNVLPLSVDQVSYDSSWESYGFPVDSLGYCSRFQGTVSSTVQGSTWDISLNCDQFNSEARFDGLSGAPVVIDGRVAGLVGQQMNYGLGARSLRSVVAMLITHSIPYSSNPPGDIPETIDVERQQTRPNQTVLDQIDEKISSDTSGKYFLVSGNPGSGKTTLAAQWQPETGELVLIDRYFVKVPENEEIPTHLRAMPERFMQWLEEVYCRVLFQRPPDRSLKSAPERILEIHNGVRQLAAHFKDQGKTGVLIIDGLDDIKPSLLNDFFSFLPAKLPEHLKVLIFATGRNALPSTLKNTVPADAEIKVTPLSILQAKAFLSGQLSGAGLTEAQLDQLAQKSEGHPLYLRYLNRYILEAEEISDLDMFIKDIPAISGNIEVYYQDIWDRVSGNPSEAAITATLARMREGVHQDQLYLMLDPFAKQGFDAGLKKIRHLLRDGSELSIYHSSFSDFLRDHTKSADQEIHDRLAQFCLDNPGLYYSVSQQIYHLLHGSLPNQQLAPKICNQEWADRCALQGVIPEITLEDIRNVISLACGFGNAEQVISLLLLSQRVYFRYDQLFHEHAFYLALALIAMGKPKEAMRYIIRNKSVVVSDNNALVLLQELFENDYADQATEMIEAIDLKCHSYLNNKDSIKINEFVNLKFKSITLSIYSDHEDATRHLVDLGDKVIRSISAAGNPPEVVMKLKHEIYGYHLAYRIHLYGMECEDIIDRMEKAGNSAAPEFTTYLTHCINRFHTMSAQSMLESHDPQIIADWTVQLEICAERYGFEQEELPELVRALMRYSKNIAFTTSLIGAEMIDVPPYDLRAENGVDLEQNGLSALLLYGETQGYTGSMESIPQSSNFHPMFWEEALMERLNALSYLSGLCKRLKAENDQVALDGLWEHFESLVEGLVPSLNQRLYFERSYLLPEQMFPVIYTLVVHLGATYFRERFTEVISMILEHCDDQLGLYTEGYTDCLLAMMLEMIKYKDVNKENFRVARIVEEYVLKTVENRWERNEYLLRIAEIYGKIGSQERAAAVFKEMIDTSMGPSWYKEAQLEIINSAVRYIRPTDPAPGIFRSFAAHLHHASGEMTFQRYVKQQQEGFIGELAQAGRLNEAISSFKYLLLPDYATVLDNAEGSLMDMPVKGKGYLQGAKSIEEQSAIAHLLKGIDHSKSLSAWALTELLLPGDTRYIRDFVKVQSKIMTHSDKDQFEILVERVIRFYQREADLEDRAEYLRTLYEELPEDRRLKLLKRAEEAGIHTPGPDSEDKSFNSSREPEQYERELIAAMKAANEQLEVENLSGARKTIVSALEKTQSERYGVWNDFTSNRIGELRSLLKSTYDKPADLLGDLQGLIYQESYGDTWELAAKLLEILQSVKDEDQKLGILSAVDFHVRMMVRTPEAVHSKYDFLMEANEQVDLELALIELLIWFLNHPVLVVKTRAIELLVWLFSQKHPIVIPQLCREISSPGFQLSRELSAAVLHQCAEVNAASFWDSFSKELNDLQALLLVNPHFMIIDSIIRALEAVSSAGVADVQFTLGNFNGLFQGKAVPGRDVDLSETHLKPVRWKLKQLTDIGILDGKFCHEFLANIEATLPLSLENTIKVSSYIDRSFDDHFDLRTVKDYEVLLHHAINIAIVKRVPWNQSDEIAGVLRQYQPSFPERALGVANLSERSLPTLISDLFENNDGALEEFLGSDMLILYLYYQEKVKRTGPKKSEDLEIEILSFAIPDGIDIDENLDLIQPVFADNDYFSTNTEPDPTCIPLFIPSEMTMVSNFDHVTPVFNPQASSLFEKGQIEHLYCNQWREGRIWGKERFGTPMQTGSIRSVPFLRLGMKPGFKLVWQVSRNDEIIIIDFNTKQMFEL